MLMFHVSGLNQVANLRRSVSGVTNPKARRRILDSARRKLAGERAFRLAQQANGWRFPV